MTSLVVKDLEVDWSAARRHKEKVKHAVRNVVTAGGYELLELARETVPDDPETGAGDLKSTGFVEVDRDGNVVVGYSSPYALRQHEDNRLVHQGRGRWKWLELTANERARDIGDKMADEARKELD